MGVGWKVNYGPQMMSHRVVLPVVKCGTPVASLSYSVQLSYAPVISSRLLVGVDSFGTSHGLSTMSNTSPKTCYILPFLLSVGQFYGSTESPSYKRLPSAAQIREPDPSAS